MKKTLFSVLACSAVLLSFTSCEMINGMFQKKESIVDYRNHKSDGTVLTRAADDITEFSYKVIENLENFDGGKNEWGGISRFQKGTDNIKLYGADEDQKAKFDALAKMISFEDHEDGFKLKFKKNADYGNLTFLLLQYVDEYGNRSTALEAEDWGELLSKDEFEIVYPLVNPNTSNKFWVMFTDDNADHYEACLFYEVNTIHGKGCVYPMPEKYDETKFVEILEGHILHIKDVIPPQGLNIIRNFKLCEQKNDKVAYGEYQNEDGSYDNPTTLGGAYFEAITADEKAAAEAGETVDFEIDLAKYLEPNNEKYSGCIDLSLSEGKGYIFTEFNYRYELDGFDGYYFSTPAIKPVPVSSEYMQGLKK